MADIFILPSTILDLGVADFHCIHSVHTSIYEIADVLILTRIKSRSR